MSQSPSEDNDPFAQLAQWGKDVERRANRAHRRRRLVQALHTPVRYRRRFAAALVVIALIACAGAGIRWLGDYKGPPLAYPTDAPPSGITATSAPTANAAAGPFAGTPAEEFPSGADGLIMPTAQAQGAWSSQEVKTALGKVRQALIASHLDRALLVDHNPAAFLSLVTPYTATWVRNDLSGNQIGVTLVRMDPSAGAQLSAAQPRVSGRTTYRTSRWGQVKALEVITNYVWVYAFDVPATWTGEHLVIVHSEEHWMFPKAGDVIKSQRGMNLIRYQGYWELGDCTALEKGLTAPFSGTGAGANPAATATEPESAYYQPDHTLDVEDGCLFSRST